VRLSNSNCNIVCCLLGLLSVLLLTAGCGNGLPQVTGLVTQDGKPLATGGDTKISVVFQPASGEGTPATATTDETGEYELSTGSQGGIAPGEYLVACSGVQFSSAATASGIPSGKRIIDRKYGNVTTSGLRFTVKEGDNRFDIALEAPQKP
jgi:hypothetical protein